MGVFLSTATEENVMADYVLTLRNADQKWI